MEEITVIQYGLGPIGAGIARLVTERSGMRLAGAVDNDPAKVGRDVGDLIGLDRHLGIPVRSRLPDVLGGTTALVVTHSTGSSLDAVRPQLYECMEAGLDVVSTCEELAFPHARDPDLAGGLDFTAERCNATLLGTGINPGLAMDVLALVLSCACQKVDSVWIRRVVDTTTRRLPLQIKTGAGLSQLDFQDRADAEEIGHVGLVESLAMVATGLGWSLQTIEETTEPVVADRHLTTEHLDVQTGSVAGVHQVAQGFIEGRQVITLDLTMALHAEGPGDFVRIDGTPDIEMAVRGIHGDLSTAAVVVNSIHRVIEADPGFLTMKDIAIPSCWAPR